MPDSVDSVIVAEVHFDREATPDDLRRLGEILSACQQSQSWIARISGLETLLKGEAPAAFSKAIFNTATGEIMPLGFDPILVWGRLDHPDRATINPVATLRAAIPAELARVTSPDPGGGV